MTGISYDQLYDDCTLTDDEEGDSVGETHRRDSPMDCHESSDEENPSNDTSSSSSISDDSSSSSDDL